MGRFVPIMTDAPGRGRKPSVPADVREAVRKAWLEGQQKGVPRSVRDLARQFALSPATVHRTLKAGPAQNSPPRAAPALASPGAERRTRRRLERGPARSRAEVDLGIIARHSSRADHPCLRLRPGAAPADVSRLPHPGFAGPSCASLQSAGQRRASAGNPCSDCCLPSRSRFAPTPGPAPVPAPLPAATTSQPADPGRSVPLTEAFSPGTRYDPAIPTLQQVVGHDWGEEITPPDADRRAT